MSISYLVVGERNKLEVMDEVLNIKGVFYFLLLKTGNSLVIFSIILGTLEVVASLCGSTVILLTSNLLLPSL